MKHIKRGRGPSMLGGVSGLFMIVIGIAWTILAGQVHWIMAVFGLCWTGIAVTNTVYNFKNAKRKNRYSEFDIVDSHEEPDPLNQRWSAQEPRQDPVPGTSSRFCPHCGRPTEPVYDFCPGCGKQLPD